MGFPIACPGEISACTKQLGLDKTNVYTSTRKESSQDCNNNVNIGLSTGVMITLMPLGGGRGEGEYFALPYISLHDNIPTTASDQVDMLTLNMCDI